MYIAVLLGCLLGIDAEIFKPNIQINHHKGKSMIASTVYLV